MSSKSFFTSCWGQSDSAQRPAQRPATRDAVLVASAAPALYQPRECINCTRKVFRGTETCDNCGRALREEVVAPDLLAAAIACMAEAKAPVEGKKPRNKEKGNKDVLLAYDDRCRLHLDGKTRGSFIGRGHPERPERVAAIMAQLHAAGLLKRCQRTAGRDATREEILAVHDSKLVAAIDRATETAAKIARRAEVSWYGPEDAMLESMIGQDSNVILDCYFNPHTAACARLAAGSAAEVACRVFTGAARHGAAIIRPPGHHAESSTAMGFCYYNNAAVAARAAQAAGARRVAIVDWDVHHGNGTQRIFYEDPSVLYMSTHRYDHSCFYPGSGDTKETGSGAGAGFTVNVPWNTSGVRDIDMLAAFRHVILPVAAEFRPDLVIVSAGFDAAEGDPLGGCRVTPAGFSHFTAMLSSLAPTVLLLEGGYNLTATAAATEACMRVLLGEAPLPLAADAQEVMGAAAAVDAAADPWVAAGLEGVSESALESVGQALRAQSQFWAAAREHLTLFEAATKAQLDKQHQQQEEQPQEPPRLPAQPEP